MPILRRGASGTKSRSKGDELMSECGMCFSAGYDFGNNDFCKWDMSFKTPMQCCEYGRTIPAGEKHEKTKFRSDSDSSKWITHHTCATCAEIAWAFFCDTRLYESLWDYVNDDLFPNFSQACLNRLETPAAKAELQRRWMKWKGLAA
jgi:hypothetical protein